MSITLELSPELEAQVLQAATQQGTDAQAFIIEATRRALDPDAALDALLEQFVAEPSPRQLAGFGALPDEALSRESFYEPDEESGL